jgi:glyoxylase-like metal-dependent hydrolase (beta-lactamase superfamily II)
LSALATRLGAVGAVVLERGWLSSNSIVFVGNTAPATIVDTGYASHADQTASLVRSALGGKRLGRVVNTHLHSDHCGGNAVLQSVFGCDVHVPRGSYEAASQWDEERLTFKATGQRCERFEVAGALEPGATVRLGEHLWEIHACGGHDADAVMLFQPDLRILISGDALWQYRVPILFEALDDMRGFDAAVSTLDQIERLKPDVVIPGHGPAFFGAADAIQRSRSRIEDYRAGRRNHLVDAQRSLMMFHLLEHEHRTLSELLQWGAGTSVFGRAAGWVLPTAASLLADELVRRHGESLVLPSRISG